MSYDWQGKGMAYKRKATNGIATEGQGKELQGKEMQWICIERKGMAKEWKSKDLSRSELRRKRWAGLCKGFVMIGKAKEAHRSVQTRYAKAKAKTI